MKTLVVRIQEDTAGPPADHHVDLFLEDGAGWQNHSLASGKIPRALPPAVAAGLANGLDALGHQLFQLLDGSGIGTKWLELRNLYPREQAPQSEGLRTMLDIRVDALRAVPWEVLASPPKRIFTDVSNPITLGPVDFKPAPVAGDWPLRVLVVVGCPAIDPIDWKTELRDVRRALNGLRDEVDYEVLLRPSPSRLATLHRDFRPHVIHVIGHGAPDPVTSRPALQLWDEQAGTGWSWTAPDILGTLSTWAPRFVFLNTCRSGDPADTFAIADAFVQAGAVAVLGMQGDIQGAAAALLAAKVYSALAAGRPLDQALAEARNEVIARADTSADWWRPRLVVSVRPDDVLRVASSVPEAQRRRIQGASDFTRLHCFVDRKEERRQLVHALRHPGAAARAVTVVMGADDVGKTDLVLWCLKGCALGGEHAVRYVDLKGQTTKGFLAVLRAIRGQDDGTLSPIRGPLPEASFRRFNFELSHWLDGRVPPDGTPAAPWPDDETRQLQPGDEKLVGRVFTSFRAALEDAARAKPLLLVIDHLEGALPQDFRKYVVPQLLDPITQGLVPNVQVLVAAGEDEYQTFGLGAVVPAGEIVRVRRFKAAEFKDLVTDFFDYCGVVAPDGFIDSVSQWTKADWKPDALLNMKNLAESVT